MMALLRMQTRAVGAEPVNHVPADIPRAGMVISTILSMLTISVLAVCFSKLVYPLVLGLYLTIWLSKENTSNSRLVQSASDKMA